MLLKTKVDKWLKPKSLFLIDVICLASFKFNWPINNPPWICVSFVNSVTSFNTKALALETFNQWKLLSSGNLTFLSFKTLVKAKAVWSIFVTLLGIVISFSAVPWNVAAGMFVIFLDKVIVAKELHLPNTLLPSSERYQT